MSSTTKKKAPITKHPVFPVTVALWFAALFGMGSLLVHPAVLESLVQTIRLDRLIPAAAPPLGFTARTLVAILLACGGALVGFIVGRALGGAPVRSRRDSAAAPVRQGRANDPATARAPAPDEPATPDDNDDLARLEAARESSPRRRGLTAQLVVDPFAAPAPLTMAEPAILNLGDLSAIEPIGALSEPLPLQAEPEVPTEPVPANALPAAADPEPVPAPEPAPLAVAPAPPPFRPRQGSAAEVLRQAPLDTLGMVELVERFAMALADRRAREAAAAQAAAQAAAMPAPEASPVAKARPMPIAEVNGHAGAELNGHAGPLDMPVAPSAPIPLHGTLDWLNGAAQAHADRAASDEEPEEGHLRSLEEGGWALPELDDEPEVDEFAEFNVPPADPDDALPADARDQPFSSLLAVKSAVRGPVPGAGLAPLSTAGASPEATEEALRKALATLQRMSGAA